MHAVRSVLQGMAGGRIRCMYCEDSLGTDIHHFRPQVLAPALAFSWSNYLLACAHCNSNRKRSVFPLDRAGLPLFVDPTAEDPLEHLALLPTSGRRGLRSGTSRRGRGSTGPPTASAHAARGTGP